MDTLPNLSLLKKATQLKFEWQTYCLEAFLDETKELKPLADKTIRKWIKYLNQRKELIPKVETAMAETKSSVEKQLLEQTLLSLKSDMTSIYDIFVCSNNLPSKFRELIWDAYETQFSLPKRKQATDEPQKED